jgi:hypothetical protein
MIAVPLPSGTSRIAPAALARVPPTEAIAAARAPPRIESASQPSRGATA